MEVDLIKEIYGYLKEYNGSVMISVQSDTCEYILDPGTHDTIAKAVDNKRPMQPAMLMACLKSRFGNISELQSNKWITRDMTCYLAFSESDPNTSAAIIENGCQIQDREFMIINPTLKASGSSVCYLYREKISPCDL
jgi:hypothetical protein